MKYIKEIPKENKILTEELLQKEWKVLKEPSLGLSIVLSMPISIILMGVTIFYYGLLFPAVFSIVGADGFSIEFTINFKSLLYVVGILMYAFLHEMIHAFVIPNAIHSKKTYWGINGCFGFVYSEEEIEKGRFILISIMPLLILTFVTPLIYKIFNFYHWYLLLLCIINAGGACVDIFNIILIAKQVPSKGLIVSNGMKTFYK